MKSKPIDDDSTVKLSDAKVQELVTPPDRPTPDQVPVEYIRNAVLCMLRRLECNNIPALTNYWHKISQPSHATGLCP